MTQCRQTLIHLWPLTRTKMQGFWSWKLYVLCIILWNKFEISCVSEGLLQKQKGPVWEEKNNLKLSERWTVRTAFSSRGRVVKESDKNQLHAIPECWMNFNCTTVLCEPPKLFVMLNGSHEWQPLLPNPLTTKNTSLGKTGDLQEHRKHLRKLITFVNIHEHTSGQRWQPYYIQHTNHRTKFGNYSQSLTYLTQIIHYSSFYCTEMCNSHMSTFSLLESKGPQTRLA